MLVAGIVGPSGAVVAIERDPRAISRAQGRASESGLDNIEFVQADIAEYSTNSSFDAAVDRCILQFLPDPVAALRSVAKQVRPDGIVAFQEVSWAPCVSLSAHLRLWPAAVSLVREAGIRSGVNMEMGPALHNAFQEAGLPAPHMRLEMELRRDPDFTRWVSDLLRSVLPQIQKLNLSHEALGDFDLAKPPSVSSASARNMTTPPIYSMVESDWRARTCAGRPCRLLISCII
jgi:ubiquinone/menaquinone biosynthesis C-methylase UbiE